MGSAHLGSDDRREQRVYVEQDEMLVGSEANRLHQSGVDPGQVPAFDYRRRRHLEEVQYLADSQAVGAAFDLEDHNCALVRLIAGLFQQQMPVEHREQTASNIYQPFDGVRHTGDPGSRQAREDLTHDPCRGRADNLTDSKDDGVKRGRVSHLY
jgi:hypothetical protein